MEVILLSTKEIRTLTVFYNTEITTKEIPLFRGAVIKSLGDKANLLYHNHIGDDTYRYAYPLIQYKRINGKAAITCVEEGADIIGQFLTETSEPLLLGDREATFEVEKVLPEKVVIGIAEGDIVELVNGPFKGEKARVQKIEEVKEEITVELIEAMVPIPVTVKGDSVRVIEKEK